MHIKLRLVFVFLLLSLMGCNTTPEKSEEIEKPAVKRQASIVNLKVMVSKQANPDVNERPSPVVVRIFQLKNLGKFSESDFYALFENDKEVLGDDLVNSEQFYLKPGEDRSLKNTVEPETHYIAVIAAFRDIEQAMWQDSIVIPAENTDQLMILVDQLKISIWKK
ncbi:MAG: type VI secretion system lipoprotein TssJ [Methyloprofundus sp.]|nr:type VI secretion system lipoprotein TssJ [Methyloprofundus sp.]